MTNYIFLENARKPLNGVDKEYIIDVLEGRYVTKSDLASYLWKEMYWWMESNIAKYKLIKNNWEQYEIRELNILLFYCKITQIKNRTRLGEKVNDAMKSKYNWY